MTGGVSVRDVDVSILPFCSFMSAAYAEGKVLSTSENKI